MNALHRPEPASPAATKGLPVIDVGPLRGGDAAQKAEVAAQLRSACENRGFFYIRNHGVSKELISRVFDASEGFFDLPPETKLALDKSFSPCNRGYEPLRAQTLEAGAPPDLKESFYIGEEIGADDPRVLAGRFNTGPNQWPSGLPAFRETMDAYFAQAHELGVLIVRALAASLDLPASHFDDYLTDAASTLRLLHYPPQPPNPSPGEKGCGAHTDFGGVTLLLQDQSGGLQVRDALDESWIDAPPVADTFVVNIGDLFERWTNGRYHSTLHRVINSSGRERLSVAFFFTGNPTHLVECLPGCAAPGEAPRYAAVTVEEHLRECYRRTYA
ncbi:2-oxoglutarate and iron-dependent oxygenase domain-containing protein [Variovorax dokdonensis]|uniref:2-oxoglutarate-dependent ethylene/succinate-forming enzyme n=1 Tax=Variovorax dokdonensis TaxID=344883 RepID=A0ABT7NDY9_9BURK|nr:2-oxoglutarate and iron-dependent oxygenase domain-containing protein [Variovorax dokdonensis]MDM0046171.1 2-oxoglutarate and iron-dependent oxygenase domain-containing protein [Variovorax dokdonensis]